MTDAADDAYNAALRDPYIIDMMKQWGAKPCPNLRHHTNDTCLICKDLGWIDANGDAPHD